MHTQTKQVRYRVHLEGGDPAGVFVTGPTQQVKSVDAHTAEVTVYAIRPGEPGGNSRRPRRLADRRRSRAQRHHAERRPGGRGPGQAGRRRRDRSVARGGRLGAVRQSGDHQEGLFAGICHGGRGSEITRGRLHRARSVLGGVGPRTGDPGSRGHGIGVCEVQGKAGFLYHMWTEVYIDGRWIPIDGTLAQGGIGAAHLKLAHSNFSDASAYSAFLPVVQVVGRLKIEILRCAVARRLMPTGFTPRRARRNTRLDMPISRSPSAQLVGTVWLPAIYYVILATAKSPDMQRLPAPNRRPARGLARRLLNGQSVPRGCRVAPVDALNVAPRNGSSPKGPAHCLPTRLPQTPTRVVNDMKVAWIWHRRWFIGILVIAACWLCAQPGIAWAEETQPAQAARRHSIAGDNAWMLVSSALVLMMTGPGLALFYCGLVRKKNVLSVMMQCVFLMCLMTVIWALWGYTLGFGGDAADKPPAVDRQCRSSVHEGRPEPPGKTASRSFPCTRR